MKNIPLTDYIHLLQKYLRSQLGLVFVLGILLFGGIALQLINPQIMRQFIDMAEAGAEQSQLMQSALLFLGLAVGSQVISVMAGYVSQVIGWRATNKMRSDLFRHCLRLDLSFHNAHTPGEMIERIDGDVSALSNFFSQFIIQVVGNVLLLVGVLVLLFQLDWRVGGVLTFFTLLNLVVLGKVRNVGAPYWAAERQASAEFFGYLEERLAGSEDIRALGAQEYVLLGFFRLMRNWLAKSLKAGVVMNLTINTTSILFYTGNALALAMGAVLYYEGSATVGVVYVIFHYTNMLMGPIQQIMFQVQDLQQATAGISRIRALLATQPRIAPDQVVISSGTRPELPANQALSVSFDSVSFAYHDEPVGHLSGGQEKPEPRMEPGYVLENLSFTLKPGEILGLLGRTGSGKTTISRLLLRMVEPEQGAVRLGFSQDEDSMLDIRQISLKHLRQRVGMVTQNVQLFHASLRDNLTFFDRSVPDERIKDILDGLGLWKWFRSLPDGLDSNLESGGGVSGGEAQLLAFARIFLREPGLIILDEASSRLDSATEQLIERAVDRLVVGRTAIVIAHRLDTIQRADTILILDHGKVEEYGQRRKLAGDPSSRFSQLLQSGLQEVMA